MINFVTRFKNDAAYLELVGDSKNKNNYFVEFIDLNTNIIEYSTNIKINYWAQLENIQNKNILIKVISKGRRLYSLRQQSPFKGDVVYEKRQDQKFNRVYIMFGSNAIGDSISWIQCGCW